LIDELDNRQRLTVDEAVVAAGVKGKSALDDYRRFLSVGGLILLDGGEWVSTENSQQLAIALRHEDAARVSDLLMGSPAYALLKQRLKAAPVGTPFEPKEFTRALTTFRTFAEVTNIAMQIAEEGIFPTFMVPNVHEFASIALKRFADLDHGDGLVSTGAWLEAIVRQDGVHPELSRSLLSEASSLGLLRRSTEGSTTDTRRDNHTFQALRTMDGRPVVQTVHLYRGDYLIPGKSSTSLRIEGQRA
jgi:hypothetical protein